jgi:amino acid adenylation domain-containing protein
MLGVLRAGGIYVPLDPTSPPARVSIICRDCQISSLLTATELTNNLKVIIAECGVFRWMGLLDNAPSDMLGGIAEFTQEWTEIQALPTSSCWPSLVESDLAYILYTSGSTGTPKGVMLTHRNAMAFVEWGIRVFFVTAQDRLSNHAPFHFDLSVFDVFVSIAAGASLAIVPANIAAFPYELAKWIARESITIWYSVPSVLKLMVLYGNLAEVNLPDLRLMLFAGEVFSIKYLHRLVEALPSVQFCNLYGPTETNVCTYCWISRDTITLQREIPIGHACEYSDVFLVGNDGKIVSETGQEGELLVRGPTVMRGYWGDEVASNWRLSNTESIFFESSGPVYQTGDWVRLGDDGNFYFVGRRDHLIKSRGYRIEIGEIETVINRIADIEMAIVIPVPDEVIGNCLEVYIVPISGVSIAAKDVRSYCAELLPHYMVPENVHIVSSLPLTSTGKVDRALLHTHLQSLERTMGNAKKEEREEFWIINDKA